jgi:transposase
MTRHCNDLDSQNWLSEKQWMQLRPVLFRIRNTQGPSKRQSDRDFLTAIVYLIHTGQSWRKLPPELGDWMTVYVRFRRWEKSLTWAYLWRELDLFSLYEIKTLFIDDAAEEKQTCTCQCGPMSVKTRLLKAVQMPIC